ncbi:MAG: Ig-like domain-containing protein, partial [Bacteroidota bacterium]|nr:Ig-like domain-containing protein [Bacteroidota bacterium]
TPTSTILLTKFEGPSQVADNYGSRIRGYICPPSTGNYIFWIASDNKSELWLSTNDQPANKIKIAYASSYTLSREWTKYPSQQSIPISLLEGTRYYIEAIHKESAEGDNLAVGWQLPNGVLERPIPGTRLSPFGVPLSVNIISPLSSSSFNVGSTISIQSVVSGGTGTIQKVEFFANTTKIGESLTSPYSFIWSNANAGLYALTAKVTDNLNNSYVSAVVNITIVENNVPVININSPVNGTIFSTPANIDISADAMSNGGNITKVEFFQDTTKIGEDLSEPFQYTWMNITSGNYTLKAVATDNTNQSGNSQTVNITVATCTTPTIIPLGSLTMCSDSVTLKTNANPGNLYQ